MMQTFSPTMRYDWNKINYFLLFATLLILFFNFKSFYEFCALTTTTSPLELTMPWKFISIDKKYTPLLEHSLDGYVWFFKATVFVVNIVSQDEGIIWLLKWMKFQRKITDKDTLYYYSKPHLSSIFTIWIQPLPTYSVGHTYAPIVHSMYVRRISLNLT